MDCPAGVAPLFMAPAVQHCMDGADSSIFGQLKKHGHKGAEPNSVC